MAKKEKKKPPEKQLKLYLDLIATIPELEAKGATTGYTSHNGHMFTFLSNEGDFGIRLPDEAREEFLKEFDALLFKQYGKYLREYVEVPYKLMKETEILKKYLKISYEYIKTLKPK